MVLESMLWICTKVEEICKIRGEKTWFTIYLLIPFSSLQLHAYRIICEYRSYLKALSTWPRCHHVQQSVGKCWFVLSCRWPYFRHHLIVFISFLLNHCKPAFLAISLCNYFSLCIWTAAYMVLKNILWLRYLEERNLRVYFDSYRYTKK